MNKNEFLRNKKNSVARQQKEAMLYNVVAKAFYEFVLSNHKDLISLTITRVKLGESGTIFYVYVYSSHISYDDLVLKVRSFSQKYSRITRKRLADALSFRYIPEVRYCVDRELHNEYLINTILDNVKQKDENDYQLSLDVNQSDKK